MAFGMAVNPASAVKLAGNIAPIVSSGVYLAPVPTIRNVVQDKSVKSLPLLPYSSMTVNAFMWMTYGTLTYSTHVTLYDFHVLSVSSTDTFLFFAIHRNPQKG